MAVEVEQGAYIYLVSTVFSQNPLHDLESLWWVGVWFLLCHYRPRKLREITVQEHIHVVKKYGGTLFNNHIGPLSRRIALIAPDIIANVDPLSFPEAVQRLTVLLESFRDQLVKYYEIYKPMASQDPSFFNPDLYRKFGDLFEDANKDLGDDKTGLWPLSHIEDHIKYLNAK